MLQAMQEADRDELCVPKGRHQPDRTAWRGGSVESHVTLGGRQVGLPRLRVRDADGEVPLASFQWAAATDALESHTLEAIAAGVTTRQYARTLVPGAGRGVGAGDVAQRRVAAVRGIVDPTACGRSSAGRWASWTCVWSASTARSSRSTAS